MNVFVQAIGNAMAIAITQVTLDCQVEGKGHVCAMAEADITKTAEVRPTALRNMNHLIWVMCKLLCFNMMYYMYFSLLFN